MKVVIVAVVVNEQEQFMVNPETDKIFRFENIEEAIAFINVIGGVPMEEIKENFLFYEIDEGAIDREEMKM